MKRVFTPLLALALLATLVPAVYANDNHKCSKATLSGQYSFTLSGWFVTVTNGQLDLPNSALVTVVGVDKFDGEGNLTTKYTYCINGSSAGSNSCSSPTPGSGTYTVNPDCSGTLAGTVGAYSLSIAGDTVYIMETDAGTNLSGTLKKQ